jgi:hypothetical protein
MTKKTRLYLAAIPALVALAAGASTARGQAASCVAEDPQFEGIINDQDGGTGCNFLTVGAANGIVNAQGVPTQVTVTLFVGQFATVDSFTDDDQEITTCTAVSPTPGFTDRSTGSCAQAVRKTLTIVPDP